MIKSIQIVGWAGRAVKGGKGIYSAAKGINAAENAMSTYKSLQAFSTLEKTEMGIYGLLSANGLSEYTTGKDMFGNELTAEQRQASLTQSIFAGLPFVPGMAKEAGKLSQQALNSTVQIGKQGADVSRAFMDDLGRSLHTGPNVAFAGGVGDVNSYLKAESRADGVGKVSGDKESYLSMLSGSSGDVVKGTGNVRHLDEVARINEIEVEFKRNIKHDPEEFARQLKDQEKGMNELTVDEYLRNREKYIAEGRAIEGNAAQKMARQEALKDKITELRKQGLSRADATKKASEWMDTQAALHNPDQIAGGRADNIGGLGDKRVNSSLGSQWKYRIDIVDEQIREMAKNMSPEEIKNTYLNVKLTQ